MTKTLNILLYVLSFVLGVFVTIKFYPKPEPEVITKVEYRESEIQEHTKQKVTITKPDGTVINADIEHFFTQREKLFARMEQKKTFPNLLLGLNTITPIDQFQPTWGITIGGRVSDTSYLAGTLWPERKMVEASYIVLR